MKLMGYRVGFVALVLLANACGGSASSEPTSDLKSPGELPEHGSKDIFIEGKRYLHRGAARFSSEPERAVNEPPGAESPHRSYLDLSDEALAEALRPIVLRGDQEYIAAEPDLAMARLIKEHVRNNAEGRSEGFAPPGLKNESELDEKSRSGRAIFGADNRVRPNHLAYPHTTVTHIEDPTSGCTATLVGPHTYITAAHCLVANSNAWKPWPTLYPGRDELDTANPHPFGSNYASYSISVPNAYWNSNSDWYYDFGIIVTGNIFSDPRPGDLAGWKGITWSSSSTQIKTRWLYLYGYPGDKPWGTPWGIGRCCDASTSIWFNDARIFYNIDAAPGQSGSGVYSYYDSSPQVVIIHKGTWSSGVETWNTGRMIDSGVFNFWASLTPDF